MTLEEVAKNHGLTPEGVDYALTQYQIVICEITCGMMSKLSYDAKDIIRTAEEHWCDTCKLKEHGCVKPMEEPYQIVCGSCGEKLAEIEGDVNVVWNDDGKYPRYCPNCGKKVKWDGKSR